MAIQSRPATQVEFRGVITSGNPMGRPFASASHCHNLRTMPGDWLRLWGGRKARYYSASGTWRQFHEYRDPLFSGWSNHLAQHGDSGDANTWKWVSLNNFLVIDILTITGTYDSNFASSNAVAICNLRNSIIIYNGLGVRDAGGSRPPFSAYIPIINQKVYFGLDPHVPGGVNPSAAVTGTGTINVVTSRKIYVGLYNTWTGHFSNGVLAGTIGPASSKQILVDNLQNLKTQYHDLIEQGFIRYVFYSTLDGGEVPYLLMDTDLITPLQQFSTSANYTITALRTDVTKEMPTENVPPRPMRWIAIVNGRLYGALMAGGAGFYTPDQRFHGGVVYSAAASDVKDREFLGSPEESWPLTNFTPSPNSETPTCGVPAPDGYRLLCCTPTSTFLVEEAADGVHEWTTVSEKHGISRIETMAQTDHGPVWTTQRNQIVRLAGERVEILSTNYQTLLRGKVVRFGTYTLDPLNQIDRYEVYFTDGTGVVHDFVTGDGYSITGDYTAGKTLTRQDALQFHILGKQHLYTQAGQPEDSLEKMRNEDYTGESTKAFTGINGEWRSQWTDFGDPSSRKNMPWIDLICDGQQLTVEWYADLQPLTTANKQTAALQATPQSNVNSMRRAKLNHPQRFFYKLVFKLAGRTELDTHPGLDEYAAAEAGADVPGAVLQARYTVENAENR